ncbi:MAG: hypothetical protein Q8Q95_01765 [bacterium]|nr:hypothetical protein [bacterium]
MIDNKFIVVLIVLALVVGALNILPPVLIWHNLAQKGTDFLLAQQSGYRDEFFQYLPRAREVFDGHWPPRNVFSGENGLSPLNPLPSAMFSPFLFLFNGNLNWAYISAQFVFAIIIFLLFFWLGWLMIRSKLWAIFFALTGVLTQIPQLIFRYYDRDFLGITLKKFIPIVRTPIDKMYFARIDDPMLTYPVLLAAIISFYYFWVRPKKVTALVAGVFAGLLAYTYLHYWLFWAIFLGVCFLWTLFSRKSGKPRLKNYLILLSTFFLILIPYVINYFNFSQINYSADYIFRLGKEAGRLLTFDYISSSWGWTLILNHIIYLVILTGVYFFYFKKKINPAKGCVFICLVVTMFLVWYTPTLFGFGFALAHFNKPIGLIIYIILFNLVHDFFKNYSQEKSKQIKVAIDIVLVVLMALLISKHTINVFILKNPPLELSRRYDFPQDIVSSWRWINKGVEGEPRVVSSSLITSLYLASYTSARPYLASGFLSPLTDSEIEDRFLTSNKLFQVSNEVLARRLDVYFKIDCSNKLCPKDSQINFEKTPWYLLSAGYGISDFYKNPQEVLKQYENILPSWYETNSDYVYYGPWEKQFGQVDFSYDRNLKLVYHNPLVKIYRVIK